MHCTLPALWFEAWTRQLQLGLWACVWVPVCLESQKEGGRTGGGLPVPSVVRRPLPLGLKGEGEQGNGLSWAHSLVTDRDTYICRDLVSLVIFKPIVYTVLWDGFHFLKVKFFSKNNGSFWIEVRFLIYVYLRHRISILFGLHIGIFGNTESSWCSREPVTAFLFVNIHGWPWTMGHAWTGGMEKFNNPLASEEKLSRYALFKGQIFS